MDPLDFDTFESVDLSADPLFALAAIVLLLGALVMWILNNDV